jgi:CelD/BcsL family acetyltransferase involved in cellulose biosynthesis
MTLIPSTDIKKKRTKPAQMLSCELIDDFSRLQELSPEWDRLWQADPRGEIFQTFAWARAWWQSYGPAFSLCAISVSDANQVIGIVPLVRRNDTITFLGQGQSDYCDIICEDHRAEEVISASLEHLFQRSGWKKCFLQNLKPGGRVLSHWGKLPRKVRRLLYVIPAEECKTILLEKDRSVLASLIQKDHTRRRLNKLRKAGKLTFRHIESKAEALLQIDSFFQHHVRRHALKGKRSSTENPEFRDFLRALVDEISLTDVLRFGVLELDGNALAWHLSFQVNGKLAFYQQTFDVEAWDYAPGEVLVHQLLLYVQDNVEREFDFTRGDEPFKARFTTHTRMTYSMYVDRPEFHGTIRHLARASTFPLLRLSLDSLSLVKRYPSLFHTYRSIRLWLRGFVARMRHAFQQKQTLRQWRQETTRECLRLFRLDKQEIELFVAGDKNPECTTPSDPTLTGREGRFTDLVDLAHEHPEILPASDVLKYRRRFKSDQIYMVWLHGKLALAAWAGESEPNEVLNLASDSSILRDGRYLLVYEYWNISSDDRHCYRELLCLLSSAAKTRQVALAVCCPYRSPHLRAELVQQGFQPRYRLVRPRLSRLFQVTVLPSPSVPSPGGDPGQPRAFRTFENHFQGSKS